jgi:tetratricopeptide (TPR) repeat protein
MAAVDDLARASFYIEGALSLDPNKAAAAWACSGWLAAYQDEPEKARESFERSLVLSPLDAEAYDLLIGIALAVSLKGEYAQAAKLIQDVLAKYPQVTWVYRQLTHGTVEKGS